MNHEYHHESHIGPTCPHCAKPMRLTHITPGIGALPELYSYYCDSCDEAETEAGEPGERRDVLATAFLGNRAEI
jgi:hypothetical protein